MSDAIPHSRPTVVPGMVEAATRVIESGQHAGGTVRRDLEAAFGQRLGVRHAEALQSGFAALHLALLAVGAAPGTRVLVPSYVCVALLHAVHACGATPLVADVDARTFNLTAATIEAALAREGRAGAELAAVIVPHALGAPADIAALGLAVPVIEDCAMALGARLGDREVGASGTAGVFSFYATKMLSTGHGGAVLTDDAGVAERIADRLQYDERDTWRPAFNYRLSDLAASVGRVQLAHLDEFLARRRLIAARYLELCGRLGLDSQQPLPGSQSAWYRFTLLASDSASRDALIEALAARGVEAKSPVYRPLHRYLELTAEAFPVTESIQARAVSIPIYPSLTDNELEQVCAAVQAAAVPATGQQRA